MSEALGPAEGFEQEPEQAPEEVVDAEFRVRKKPLMHRLFPWTDPERKARKGKVRLIRIERVDVERAPYVEYAARVSYVSRADLPMHAVHQTGAKGTFVEMDMEPVYPEYADPDAEKDEDGNFVRPHNFFDAFGYFKWFADQRIKKGYEALGTLERTKPRMDWRTIGIAALVIVIVIGVVLMFYGGRRWAGSAS